MAQEVTVEIQPGERLRFPRVCLHCGQVAGERLRLCKRRGPTTREIEAPLCADCRSEVQRLSGDEERWHKMGWLFGGLTLVFGVLLFYLLLPGWLPPALRLILSLGLSGAVAAGVIFAFRRASLRQARPEKRAILQAARLHTFSRRAAVFVFENEAFAERFAALNEGRLRGRQRA